MPIHPTIDSARALLKDLQEIPIPEGETRDRLVVGDKKLPSTPLIALAEFIEKNENPALASANRELLDRLRGTDETDPNSLPQLLLNLAASKPDEAGLRTIKIKNALKLTNQGLFKTLHAAIKTIARDNEIELDIIGQELLGEKPQKPSDSASGPAKRKGTWRESSGNRANTSKELDKIIRQEAEEYDAGRPSDAEISRIANEGIEEFQPPPGLAEYKNRETENDFADVENKYRLGEEINAYAKLAARVERLVTQHLGEAVGLKARRTGQG